MAGQLEKNSGPVPAAPPPPRPSAARGAGPRHGMPGHPVALLRRDPGPFPGRAAPDRRRLWRCWRRFRPPTRPDGARPTWAARCRSWRGFCCWPSPSCSCAGLALFLAGIVSHRRHRQGRRRRAGAGGRFRLERDARRRAGQRGLALVLVARWPVSGQAVVAILVGIRMLAAGWSMLLGREPSPGRRGAAAARICTRTAGSAFPRTPEFATLRRSLPAEEAKHGAGSTPSGAGPSSWCSSRSTSGGCTSNGTWSG